MKRRNREVNIFSVSLLDILCGALGAFCFMTIVLMPYYKPDVADAHELQLKQQELQQEIERLKAALRNSPNGEELVKRLEELQRRVQQMQGQMNQQARQLEQERKERQRLADRNPITITMGWEAPYANMNLYPRAVSDRDPKRAGEPVDSTKQQASRFNGDSQLFCTGGPCFETAMLRDNPPGWSVEVYYKYLSASGSGGPVRTRAYYQHEGRSYPLPVVTLDKPGTAVQVGKIQVKPDRTTQFLPAAAYAEEYRRTIEAWTKPSN